MIEIENTEVVGWEHAIRGMRNPLNSWDKSDSIFSLVGNAIKKRFEIQCELGNADLDLMNKLSKAGSDHSKFLRMIVIYTDIVAPLYWWKEFDTYKVGTVRNSCSTMHKIHSKEFNLDDFSCEHLIDDIEPDDWATITDEDGHLMNTDGITCLSQIIKVLNCYRDMFLETKDKKYWWQMIQLLPSNYNQRSTVMLNYQVLKNMYHSRKNHKLDEWHVFCDWVESLPYSELITGEGGDSDDES